MKIVKTNIDYKLTEAGEFIKNKTKKSTKKDAVNFFPLEIMESGEIYLTKNKKVDDSIKSDLTIVEKNNILYGKCRPLLNKAIIAPTNGLTTGEVLVYETDFTNFFIHLFHSKKFINHNVSNSSGSKMPRTSNEIVKSFKFNFISESHMIKTGNILHENYIKLENIKELIKKIEIRNQYYADKLLNGELTVQNGKIVVNRIPLNKKVITTLFDLKMGETILSVNISNIKINENDLPVYSATEESKIFGYIEINKVKKILGENDIILAARGNSIGALKFTAEMKTSTQTTIQIVSKTKYSSYLVYKYLQNNRDKLFLAQGAAIPQITIDGIKNIEIPIIDNLEIENYLKKLDLEKEKVEKLLKLEDQRFEWLSDKLLSGEYVIED